MNPDTNNPSDVGVPQSGGDLGQLPPIHPPESFHAPSEPAHFAATAPQPAPISAPPAAVQVASPQPATPSSTSAPDPLAQLQNSVATAPPPAEDVDTEFDEEWVGKAREIVAHTHTDPYMQSQTMSKLKAQYIKARYNKDIKVSED
ncbi:MAG TPA: hypothetical protein VF733_04615 [Candidatus Saccharimonadales bacterium]